MYRYAGVIVDNSSVQLDKIFTYKIPAELQESIDIGYRVTVPFGLGNKKIYGFVLELYEEFNDSNNIKSIIEICDDFQVINPKFLSLIKSMKEKYICTLLECIKTVIPTGITKGVKLKTTEILLPGNELTGKFLKEPYISIYKTVKERSGTYNKSELSKVFNFSLSSINTMLKHNFIVKNEEIVNRYNNRDYSNYAKPILNEEQQSAVSKIMNSNKNISLIHGITGSGKTEIYMNLVSNMMEKGRESIILVPEISLTPQMVERFKGRFGKNVAVFHSRLSDGERFDEWIRVKHSKVKVAIGARSAVFLPFNNLGLIIIDEEHESSYKSESDPKYNAKEIAELRCEFENCKLVLGSATPSIESYFRCIKDEIQLIELNKRADGASLPYVEVVDMREELLHNNKSMFSRKLYSEIAERLLKREQVILFLNRRGYSTFVSCRKCGFVFKCSNCDISLTYHNEFNKLTCHYCGSTQKQPKTCPKCGSNYVKHFGVGTEKVELEIERLFPEARTIRMDFDTTRTKESYENIYNSFKDQKADILIGTQMIAKGLDFKNVTLVGVIAADLSLNLPDYRSGERTFQLITQVSGRAGRGSKEGKVIIQTYNPENYSIIYSSKNDYSNFYKHEIEIRQNMYYPPFCRILNINFSSEKEELLIKIIQNIGLVLKNKVEQNGKIEILGPCPCSISKIKNQYRWQIILKGDFDFQFADDIRLTIYKLLKDVYNDIRVSMDINPNSLL